VRSLIAVVTLSILAAGCDPGWRVGMREPLASPLETECVRDALLDHPRVLGAILVQPNPSYSIVGKRLPDPTVFHFETDIGLAYLTIEKGDLDVAFGAIGTGPPPSIAEGGPSLVEEIFSWVSARCGG
jgi:hypothetical protein